jgi:hypothetical protein
LTRKTESKGNRRIERVFEEEVKVATSHVLDIGEENDNINAILAELDSQIKIEKEKIITKSTPPYSELIL